MKTKVNNIYLGIILGILVPAITVFLVYKIRFNQYNLEEFFNTFIQRKVLSSLLSLCIIPNLLVFMIFIWLNHLYSARGVLLSTFIIGFIIVGVKFLL
jgi:mannose/fructose/N-acetylgalactosamine-specific phosphotransferase system component IID